MSINSKIDPSIEEIKIPPTPTLSHQLFCRPDANSGAPPPITEADKLCTGEPFHATV